MATTVSTTTLNVVIKENLDLLNSKRGSKTVFEDTSVGEVSRRTVSVTHATNGVVLMKFASGAEAAGTYDTATFKYLRITNLDSTVGLIIGLVESDNNHYAQFLVPAGKSFLLSSLVIDNNEDIDTFGSDTIDIINAKAATGSSAINVEYVVVT